jgi:phenol 2-monooxygenase
MVKRELLITSSVLGIEKVGVIVLRPDMWVGTSTTLNGNTVAELEVYFKRLLLIHS